MKRFVILTLFVASLFTFGCASQFTDIEFGYFAKAQEKRVSINDVFFNSTHSAYQEYRMYPEENVAEDEVAIFIEEKLPANHHPVDNETMNALLKELENHHFFVLGRSVDSFKQAIKIFKSENYIKQCFVLIVDGHVTIAIPPKSLGTSASKASVERFKEIMDEFRVYGGIYALFSQQFKRAKVETNAGLNTFMKDVERTHELGEEERRDIDDNRDRRERIHGD